MNKKIDLTQGEIFSKLVKVSTPIMATSFMQMAYNLTDMFWLGRLSSGAVAASGTAGMFLWLSFALIFIGRMGAEIGVSQSIGRKEYDTARKYAQNSLNVAGVLGLSYCLFLIFFRVPLVGFFRIPDLQVVQYTQDYLSFSALAMPFIFLNQTMTGAFIATGNTKLPFLLNSAGLVVNIILSPILIFTFNLGVLGAAIGTIIAFVFAFCLFVIAMLKSKNRPFESFKFFSKPEKIYVRQIFKWGAPVGLESGFFTFLSMVVAMFIAEHGVGAIAVQRVGTQIESLTWLLAGAFATAVTAFIGQNLGAKKYSRIHAGFKLAMVAMVLWGAVVTVILLVFPAQLIGIFLTCPDEIALGVTYLRIFAVMQISACTEMGAAGVFRGRGLTHIPSIVTTGGNVLRTVLAVVLMQFLGLYGIWIGVVIGSIIRAICMILWCMHSIKQVPKIDGVEYG